MAIPGFKIPDFLIYPTERFWVDMQPFLLERGYRLRPRYDPNWKPSWLRVQSTTGQQPYPLDFEDSLASAGRMVDAVRIEDDRKVVFKKVKTSTNEDSELAIALLLSSDKMRADPRNCAVPILDVIPIPGDAEHALLVMPQLLPFHVLPFRRLGEFCEMALQFLEGLLFMHEENIAHRDACWGNLMMDHSKVVPKGTHFRKWNSHDGVHQGLEWNPRWSVSVKVIGNKGQDDTVPELSTTGPYDPFPVDIYQLGGVFRRCIKGYQDLAAFQDLADRMTSDDPKARPTAEEAVGLCKDIIAGLEKSKKLEERIWRLQSKTIAPPTIIDKLAVFLGMNPMN